MGRTILAEKEGRAASAFQEKSAPSIVSVGSKKVLAFINKVASFFLLQSHAEKKINVRNLAGMPCFQLDKFWQYLAVDGNFRQP